MGKAISFKIAQGGRPSHENGNPNAKKKPVYCFRIPAYAKASLWDAGMT